MEQTHGDRSCTKSWRTLINAADCVAIGVGAKSSGRSEEKERVASHCVLQRTET